MSDKLMSVLCDKCKSDYEQLQAENKRKDERIDELEKAVVVYANKENYTTDTGYGFSVIDNDCGKIATEALNKPNKDINNG